MEKMFYHFVVLQESGHQAEAEAPSAGMVTNVILVLLNFSTTRGGLGKYKAPEAVR